jgi:hypothetical protein
MVSVCLDLLCCVAPTTGSAVSVLTNVGTYGSREQPLPCAAVATHGMAFGFQAMSTQQNGELKYYLDAYCPIDPTHTNQPAPGCAAHNCPISGTFTVPPRATDWPCMSVAADGSSVRLLRQLPICPGPSSPEFHKQSIAHWLMIGGGLLGAVIVGLVVYYCWDRCCAAGGAQRRTKGAKSIKGAMQIQEGSWNDDSGRIKVRGVDEDSLFSCSCCDPVTACVSDFFSWISDGIRQCCGCFGDAIVNMCLTIYNFIVAIFEAMVFGWPQRLYFLDALQCGLALSFVFSLWQSSLWLDPKLNPLGVFVPATFRAWGIPIDNYDMTKFYEAMHQWNLLGNRVFVSIVLILGTLLVLRSALVKSLPNFVTLFGLFLTWIGMLGVYFGFPLFVHFASLVSLKTDSSDYLKDNPSEAGSVANASKMTLSVLSTTCVCHGVEFVCSVACCPLLEWVSCFLFLFFWCWYDELMHHAFCL